MTEIKWAKNNRTGTWIKYKKLPNGRTIILGHYKSKKGDKITKRPKRKYQKRNRSFWDRIMRR